MALRPAPDLDPRLSARHPLAPRKQRSAAGREPRPRADPPTATYLTRRRLGESERLQPCSELGSVDRSWRKPSVATRRHAQPECCTGAAASAPPSPSGSRGFLFEATIFPATPTRDPHHNCTLPLKRKLLGRTRHPFHTVTVAVTVCNVTANLGKTAQPRALHRIPPRYVHDHDRGVVGLAGLDQSLSPRPALVAFNVVAGQYTARP